MAYNSISGSLFALAAAALLLLAAPARTQNENITCIFEGCQCQNVSSNIIVVCVINPPEVVRPNYFPPRNLSSQIKVINNLLISKYDFRTIPDDIFSGLSVRNLQMIGNNLLFVGANSFRGVKDLDYLLINDRFFYSFAENSSSPFRESLTSLDLSDSEMDESSLERLLPELRKLTNLQNLHLNYNFLAKIAGKHLSLFPNLKQLSLVSNSLSEFQDPKMFQVHKQLASVVLEKNKISDLSKILPALQQIESTLTQLKLNENQLEAIQEIRLSKLQVLSLAANKIKTISPNAFSTLSDLRQLDLSGNQLVALDGASIAPLTKLNTLMLSNNLLRAFPDISNLAELSSVDLSNQNDQLQLQDYAFNRLKFSNQMEINLDENRLSGRISDKAFCSRAKRTTDIKSISINYESIKTVKNCNLKQLKQDSVPSLNMIVTGVSSNGNYDACNCDFDNYALASNVNLTGICEQYTASCKQAQLLDTCATQPQFTCSSSLLRQSCIILISLLALAFLI